MIVHLGWIGSEPPPRVLAAVEAARSVCRACDVMLHVGDDAIPQARRAAMEARSLTPHMRSDIQRHAVLERYGGLWIDSDVRLIASPCEWTAGWDRYTAIRLVGAGGPVGTDIIYVPVGWAGWPAVNDYMDQLLAGDRRIGTLDLASTMIQKTARRLPDLFTILPPGDWWPYDPRTFTVASVVARGFDPPTSPPAAMPSLAQRAATFTQAAARHVAAGMPRASDEEIERRFAICQGCEHYDGSACRKCGCGISRSRRFASKLAWANERCPAGQW